GPERIQDEPEQNSILVADAAHDEACRQRHGEIPEIEGGLNEPRLHAREIERLLKLLDQNVIEVVGNGPHEKRLVTSANASPNPLITKGCRSEAFSARIIEYDNPALISSYMKVILI